VSGVLEALEITAEKLACARGGRMVFADVSFTLKNGDALQIVGRNGAGKTSLLRVLAGLLPARSGVLRVFSAAPGRVAEQSHFIGHSDALKGALSAGENLDFARALLGSPGLPVGEALEVFGLAALRHLPVARLSAGQRRRVALARLLVAERPLWLLDEPFTALDAASEETLNGVMRAHRAKGGIVIAATHRPLALERLATLEPGRAAAGG
jgi:heme exporter protein A